MDWYWIVLIIFGYIVIGAVVGAVIYNLFYYNTIWLTEDDCVCAGIFWPIVVAIAPLIIVFAFVYKSLKGD